MFDHLNELLWDASENRIVGRLNRLKEDYVADGNFAAAGAIERAIGIVRGSQPSGVEGSDRDSRNG